NQELHEQAALLLGAFLLREHSGKIFEIRSPLSRIAAHLTMARFLSGANSYGVNGRLAEATLLTLVNDEAPAPGTIEVHGHQQYRRGEHGSHVADAERRATELLLHERAMGCPGRREGICGEVRTGIWRAALLFVRSAVQLHRCRGLPQVRRRRFQVDG